MVCNFAINFRKSCRTCLYCSIKFLRQFIFMKTIASRKLRKWLRGLQLLEIEPHHEKTCSATENSQSLGSLYKEIIGIMLSRVGITRALIRLGGLRLCCSHLAKIGFVMTRFILLGSFNPYLPNGLVCPYYLNKSISNFRVSGVLYHFY